MVITGQIKNVRFFNEDNGYTIASFILSTNSFKESIEYTSNRMITIVGSFDRKLGAEEELELTGNYVKNQKYGLQFSVSLFKRITPENEESIIKYLSSDIFPGIGLSTATKIVNKLGLSTIQKIIKDSSCLEGIGLSRKQIDVIKEGITKDQVNQEALLYYLSGGLTIDIASKIINTLGINNLELVKQNPYIIMEKVSRFGFIKNDRFALNIGVKKDSDERLLALILYILKETIYNFGNSYVLYSDLLSYLENYLNKENTKLNQLQFNKLLDQLQQDKKIYIEYDKSELEKKVFDYTLYKQEIAVSRLISSMIKKERGKTPNFTEELINHHYQLLKEKKHINFSKKQEDAILSSLTKDIMIITGGPGTGKTTIIKTVLELYTRLHNEENDIAVLAPTGRAAKRIKETSKFDAMTIHRYLGYDGAHFAYSKENPRPEKLVIVDESSMMDLSLFYQLITSISPNARLIIVGDVDQLPSIGPGQILKDLIDSKEIDVVRLDQIHRQAENSSIISLAHSINEGILPESILEKKHDRSFIMTDNDNLLGSLETIVKRTIEKGYDIQKDIQVLIPMYKSDVGIDNVNKMLQELINPFQDKEYFEYKHLNKIFRVNDKIIQLINRPEKGIMNGDIGYITSLNVEKEKIVGLSALFEDTKVDYTIDELEEINLAYAVTIHKAQGSEFKIVIMPISSYYYAMLKRKLIYTGITRAKEKLILLGDINMLKFAVSRIEQTRKTILKEEIKKHLNNQLNDNVFVYNVPLYQEEHEEPTTIGEEEINLDDFDLL